MASRIFARVGAGRLIGGAAVGATGIVGSSLTSNTSLSDTPAKIQFDSSYGYINKAGKQIVNLPPGWTGRVFQIRNDYPKPSDLTTQGLPPISGPDRPLPNVDPLSDARWLEVDFKSDPETYCSLIKAYCYEGNVDNEFVLQKNTVRQWYHAPWMHWNPNGREPLNGLTFERPTPPKEFAETQNRMLQTWACGYYNFAGKTTVLREASLTSF